MSDATERLWRRMLMMVGRGRLRTADDAGAVQIAQVQLGADEIKDRTPRLAEYGLTSVPPDGSDAIVLFLGGERSNGVIVATGSQQYRLRGLASGDVALYDSRGQTVTLTSSGITVTAPTVTVNADQVAVTADTLTVTADLVVHGNTTFDGTVSANGHAIDETHTHGGVDAGSSTSGPVS